MKLRWDVRLRIKLALKKKFNEEVTEEEAIEFLANNPAEKERQIMYMLSEDYGKLSEFTNTQAPDNVSEE